MTLEQRLAKTLGIRLRFDKVAMRVMAEIRASVSVPKTVLVTITAPIRLPSKTALAITEKIARGRDSTARIHGNAVRIHFISGDARVLGFVHNPDVDSRKLLIDIEAALL